MIDWEYELDKIFEYEEIVGTNNGRDVTLDAFDINSEDEKNWDCTSSWVCSFWDFVDCIIWGKPMVEIVGI